MEEPTIGLVNRDEIVELRWTVLRPMLPQQASLYPEDDHPEIFHLAARDQNGIVVGCATFVPQPHADQDAWRLRGMAIAPEYRGHGMGGSLLRRGLIEVDRRGGQLVWCTGRIGVTGFYQRHGFRPHGEVFELAPNGPHVVLICHIGEVATQTA